MDEDVAVSFDLDTETLDALDVIDDEEPGLGDASGSGLPMDSH